MVGNFFGLCAVNGLQFFWTLRCQWLAIFLDSVRSMQTFLALKVPIIGGFANVNIEIEYV